MTELESKVPDAVKQLILDVVIKRVIARAVLAAPFLAYPVFYPVFVFIVEKLFDVIYAEMSLTVSFVVIDFKNAAHRAAYDKAVEELKAAMAKGDASAIEVSKNDFRSTLRDLIRMRPSTG